MFILEGELVEVKATKMKALGAFQLFIVNLTNSGFPLGSDIRSTNKRENLIEDEARNRRPHDCLLGIIVGAQFVASVCVYYR